MMVFNRQMMTGAAIALLTGLAVAQPGIAGSQQSNTLHSQVNRPETEGIPALNTEEVRGRVTRVEGDQVELRLANGELRTYSLAPNEPDENRPAVGSDVILTVRGGTIVAINTAGTGSTSQSGGTTSSDTMRSGPAQSGSASSSSSSSSSTTVRRQTTVQQTTPQQTTTPAPAPAAQPAQPVRGLW